MTTITPFIYFSLPAMASSISLMQYTLVCAALMISTYFVVRTFNLREKLMAKTTDYSREIIDAEFKKDSIKFPTFDKSRKHIEYNSLNQVDETVNTSFLITFLVFLLKILQNCIILSLAVIELLEVLPSFCADLIFDVSLSFTHGDLRRSDHLLYTSVKNLVLTSILDKPVDKFIDTPKATCAKSECVSFI